MIQQSSASGARGQVLAIFQLLRRPVEQFAQRGIAGQPFAAKPALAFDAGQGQHIVLDELGDCLREAAFAWPRCPAPLPPALLGLRLQLGQAFALGPLGLGLGFSLRIGRPGLACLLERLASACVLPRPALFPRRLVAGDLLLALGLEQAPGGPSDARQQGEQDQTRRQDRPLVARRTCCSR